MFYLQMLGATKYLTVEVQRIKECLNARISSIIALLIRAYKTN